VLYTLYTFALLSSDITERRLVAFCHWYVWEDIYLILSGT